MKIGLLGAGKTGQFVHKLHEDTVIFNSKNKPTLIELKKCDILISFLAGDIFLEYMDLIIESKIPLVNASTGFTYPENISEVLQNNKTKWIYANNFSLGMNIFKKIIHLMGQLQKLYPEGKYHLVEHHHIHKKDAPSGTALSMKDWLNLKNESSIDIESVREGDIVGIHHLKFSTPKESIEVGHIAHNREIFASGALFAAKLIFENNININFGLHHFNDIVNHYLDHEI